MTQSPPYIKRRLLPNRPSVLMVGDFEHAEFRDVVELLRADANLVASASASPEVVVFFHSPQMSVRFELLQNLQQSAPLAWVVVIAGSWCEGETRTGRAGPGVHRHYWYE